MQFDVDLFDDILSESTPSSSKQNTSCTSTCNLNLILLL